ncbi:hypothetical protein P3S67_012006 [Capsicum chacoense]
MSFLYYRSSSAIQRRGKREVLGGSLEFQVSFSRNDQFWMTSGDQRRFSVLNHRKQQQQLLGYFSSG